MGSNWTNFSDHRMHLMSFLCNGKQGGRICILGAGYCDDINLQQLIQAYNEIHLVDIDGERLTKGLDQQHLINHPQIIIHPNLDVAPFDSLPLNMAENSSRFDPFENKDLLENYLKSLEIGVANSIGTTFDFVVSVGLLSQIIDSAILNWTTLNTSHLPTIQTIIIGHVCLILRLLQKGGSALLGLDLFSSVTCRELWTVSNEDLLKLVQIELARGNFFVGLSPKQILPLLNSFPPFYSQIQHFQILEPWKWDYGARMYAMWGLQFQKS